MNKNTRTVVTLVIGAVVLLAFVYFFRDLYLRHPRCFDCGDGKRCSIDTRQFATQYSAYSLQLEASLNDRQKLSAKIDPVQLQKLSEALQSANEYRKYVVVGFNSCGISKGQYEQLGRRFQALDNLAQTINELTSRPLLTPQETAQLAELIKEYGNLAQTIGSD